MALPSIAVAVVIVAVTTTLAIETGTSGRHNEDEAFFPIISTNFMEKSSFNSFPEFRARMSKKTCGLPSPECTSECVDARGFCTCKKQITPLSYKNLPCREYGKMCAAGEHESFSYSKLHPYHSAAMPPKRGYTYLRQGVTDEEKQQILYLHNNYRAKVARGEEHRSPEQGVSQPSGSNIKELIWNDELAYIAQKWAEQCDFNHESPSSRRATCSRPYNYVGQNLFKSTKSLASIDNQWAQAIELWYEEVADTPISLVKDYARGLTDKMIDYTQLLWASTYEIGCGAAYYKSGPFKIGSATIYVCNYGPGGNTNGSEIYAIGRPASKCGESGKSARYNGLCATTEPKSLLK